MTTIKTWQDRTRESVQPNVAPYLTEEELSVIGTKQMQAEIAELRAAIQALPRMVERQAYHALAHECDEYKRRAEVAERTQQGDTCAQMRALCSACGGTGDVHSVDGEWRGSCDCPASQWKRDELDAKRYRWLRNTDPQPERWLDVCDDDHRIIDGKELDAAIDIALAARGEG